MDARIAAADGKPTSARLDPEGKCLRMDNLFISLARRLPGRHVLVRCLAACKRAIRNNRVRRYRRETREPMIQTRVLVIMNAGVGNAIMATPLVQAIRMIRPRAHLSILPPPGDLFDGWCVADDIVKNPALLKGACFDDTFIAWMSAIPEPPASFSPGRIHRAEGLYNRWPLKPEHEINMAMIRRLGYRGPTPPLFVAVTEPANPPPSAPQRIALAPGGKPDFKFRHKRWPFFGSLTELLLSRYSDAQLCIVGGPDDEFPGGVPQSSRVVDLRGRLTWRESAWILQHSHLAIGNDCGPMHVADAVLCPTVVLFGPTCDLKNGPRYRGITLSRDVECSPCHYTPSVRDACQDPRCMTGLTAEGVVIEVDRILETSVRERSQPPDHS